jgi:RNA polymerase sigma factor (sigma-70 family)
MTRLEFNGVVRQLNRRLFIYAFRILRNQEEAEDAVQEIFIKLWKMGDRLKEYKSMEALATTMVKNFCIDQIRRKKPLIQEELSNKNSFNLASLSPHEQLEEKESKRILHRIIGNLPDIYRTVIELREIDGFSYEEISEKTGQNINTLRVNLSRARGFIRDEYNKYHNEHKGIKQAARKVL